MQPELSAHSLCTASVCGGPPDSTCAPRRPHRRCCNSSSRLPCSPPAAACKDLKGPKDTQQSSEVAAWLVPASSCLRRLVSRRHCNSAHLKDHTSLPYAQAGHSQHPSFDPAPAVTRRSGPAQARPAIREQWPKCSFRGTCRLKLSRSMPQLNAILKCHAHPPAHSSSPWPEHRG